MSDSPSTTNSVAEAAVRLSQGSEAYRSPPTFKPGDTVRLAQFCTTIDVNTPSAHAIGNVMEIVPSLRKFTGNQASFVGQGILVAFICHDGSISMQWVGSWMYELASPEQIRGGAPLHG